MEFPQFFQVETRFFEDAERDPSIQCQPLGAGGADVENELYGVPGGSELFEKGHLSAADR